MLHRTARQFLALSAALLTLIVATLLSAAPVLAQVLPPDPVLPAAVRNTPTPAGSTGTALWTYVLVAAAALLIGAAITYVLTRSQKNRHLVTVEPRPTVAA